MKRQESFFFVKERWTFGYPFWIVLPEKKHRCPMIQTQQPIPSRSADPSPVWAG
jgi:hypothetical protein